ELCEQAPVGDTRGRKLDTHAGPALECTRDLVQRRAIENEATLRPREKARCIDDAGGAERAVRLDAHSESRGHDQARALRPGLGARGHDGDPAPVDEDLDVVIIRVGPYA